jgi:hypothetical protein
MLVNPAVAWLLACMVVCCWATLPKKFALEMLPSVVVVPSEPADAELDLVAVGSGLGAWRMSETLSCVKSAEAHYQRGTWARGGGVIKKIAPCASWVNRDARPEHNQCFAAAAQPCFRGVADLQLSAGELAEAMRVGRDTTNGTDSAPLLTARLRLVFAEQYGVKGLRLQQLARTVTSAASSFNGQDMHSDMCANPRYWYSALLYTSEAGRAGDFDAGGHTLFLDAAEMNRAGGVAVGQGHAVAPKVGRVVLFSSGLENIHGRVPISAGRRGLLQFWFSCGSPDADSCTVAHLSN